NHTRTCHRSRPEHILVNSPASAETRPDQRAKSARQLKDACQRVVLQMTRRIGLIEPAVACLRPARIIECARWQRSDVARKRFSGKGCNEVKTRSWPSRPCIHNGNQPPDTAKTVLLGQPGDFCVNRVGDLLGDQTARVKGKIAKQKCRKQGKNGQIDQRQLKRRRTKKFTERRHVSCIPRRGSYAGAAGKNLYRFSNASARCARQ